MPPTRRSVLLCATVVLCTLTATALMATALLLIPGPVVRPAPATGDEVVRRFYAAANDAIATGDPTALRAVVAPDFVERDPLPGRSTDRAGLEQYLSSLHVADPGIRLVVDEVVASDDRAAARVSVRLGQGPTGRGVGTVDRSALWGAVDIFRLAGDQVVDRRGVVDGLSSVEAVAESPVTIPIPPPPIVTLERLTYATGATRLIQAPGPLLLYVEDGTFRVETIAPSPGTTLASIAGPAPDGASPQLQSLPRAATALTAGQSLVVATGTRCHTNNVGTGPARLLVVTFAWPASPGGARRAKSPGQAASAASADARPPDIAAETLAGGLLTEVHSGPALLTVQRITFAREARLVLPDADGPTLISVDAGQLEIAAGNDGWVRRGADGRSVSATEAMLGEGDGALLNPGGVALLQNAGDVPAVALVVTITRGSAASTAAAPETETAVG